MNDLQRDAMIRGGRESTCDANLFKCGCLSKGKYIKDDRQLLPARSRWPPDPRFLKKCLQIIVADVVFDLKNPLKLVELDFPLKVLSNFTLVVWP